MKRGGLTVFAANLRVAHTRAVHPQLQRSSREFLDHFKSDAGGSSSDRCKILAMSHHSSPVEISLDCLGRTITPDLSQAVLKSCHKALIFGQITVDLALFQPERGIVPRSFGDRL